MTAAPAYLSIPPRAGSHGDEAVDLAAMAGRKLDEAQRLAVDALLSYGPDGRPVAMESVIVESRQNGKTGGVLLPVVFYDLFLCPPDRIVWTAHLFKTAADAFADAVACIEFSAELSRRVKKITYGNGDEAIELHAPGYSASTGARLEFLARSKGGGRGLGGKRLVMDEALFLAAGPMAGLLPTLSARLDPQVNYGSSAGLATSDHLATLQERGRAGDPTLIYLEWRAPGSWSAPGCAAPKCSHEVGKAGCALDDETLWAAANPALDVRITRKYVRSERQAFKAMPREFARERLGWEDETAAVSPIPRPAWLDRSGAEGRPEGLVVFAVSASWPDAEFGSVGVAGRRDGALLVQVVEHRPGTSWIPARVAELTAAWPAAAVMLDDKDPVAREKTALETAGVALTAVSSGEAAQAFGMFLGEVTGDAPTLRHYSQPELDSAVEAATRRPVGDGWTWARRGPADISPLVAVTYAAYGHAVKANQGAFFAAYR